MKLSENTSQVLAERVISHVGEQMDCEAISFNGVKVAVRCAAQLL